MCPRASGRVVRAAFPMEPQRPARLHVSGAVPLPFTHREYLLRGARMKRNVVEDEAARQLEAGEAAELPLHVVDASDEKASSFGARMKRAASKLYNWVALMIVLGALLG